MAGSFSSFWLKTSPAFGWKPFQLLAGSFPASGRMPSQLLTRSLSSFWPEAVPTFVWKSSQLSFGLEAFLAYGWKSFLFLSGSFLVSGWNLSSFWLEAFPDFCWKPFQLLTGAFTAFGRKLPSFRLGAFLALDSKPSMFCLSSFRLKSFQFLASG